MWIEDAPCSICSHVIWRRTGSSESCHHHRSPSADQLKNNKGQKQQLLYSLKEWGNQWFTWSLGNLIDCYRSWLMFKTTGQEMVKCGNPIHPNPSTLWPCSCWLLFHIHTFLSTANNRCKTVKVIHLAFYSTFLNWSCTTDALSKLWCMLGMLVHLFAAYTKTDCLTNTTFLCL